jgi:hypothetical protein
VEAAAYPAAGVDLDLNAADFGLRCESGEVLRAAEPKAIARRLQEKNAPHGTDIDLFPTAGVGYESGPYGRGVTRSAGVAVGVNRPGRRDPPPPIATAASWKPNLATKRFRTAAQRRRSRVTCTSWHQLSRRAARADLSLH